MRFFIFFILPLILLCSFSGCSHIASPNETLRVGIGAEPATLDPALMQGLAENRVLSSLFEGLVLPFPQNDSPISAGVSNAWEVKNGGCRIIFHLRHDVLWSNGEALIAQDFIDSWRRAMSPELAAPNAQFFDTIEGAKNFRHGKGTWSQVGLKARDPWTLEVRLEKPSQIFLQILTQPIFYPVYHAREIGTQRGTSDWTKPGRLVSNGAFRLAEHKPYEKIVVEQNKKYWGKKKVTLKQIEFYPIDNRASEETAFLSGVLDITMSVPLNKVPAYAKDPRLHTDPSLQVGYLVVNTRRKPLDNIDIRRMLSLSLNREALCTQVLRSGQTPAYRFVPQGNKNFLNEDPGEAAEVLKKASPETRALINKIVLRFNSSEARKLISETLQSQWQKNINVNITLENLEWKTFLSARQHGDYDLAQAGWSADYDDASSFLELFISDNPNNVTGWKNLQYDRAVDARDFAKAEEILLRELPCIPLYFTPNVYLMNPRVKGWEASPLDVHDWRKVSLQSASAGLEK